MIYVGTAGWAIPKESDREGTRLFHYSRTFPCAEINSSFYRSHRAATWARWAAQTPPEFRFAIKAPRAITHEAKLRDTKTLLNSFFAEIAPIGTKAGIVLFQLPPSLAFDSSLADDFFALLRSTYQRQVVIEPRHATWFDLAANALLRKYAISRVAVDPATASVDAAEPAGDTSLAYYRLHGSPRMYYSSYEPTSIAALAARVELHPNAWVIFDNTAHGHAYANALDLQSQLA